MTVKCTGAEFKKFMDDDEFWPKDVYYEDGEITVDGVIDDDIDCRTLADSAKITVAVGMVCGFKGEPSLEGHLRKWLKLQNTCTITIECAKEKREEIEIALKSLGVKILK